MLGDLKVKSNWERTDNAINLILSLGVGDAGEQLNRSLSIWEMGELFTRAINDESCVMRMKCCMS